MPGAGEQASRGGTSGISAIKRQSNFRWVRYGQNLKNKKNLGDDREKEKRESSTPRDRSYQD